MKNGSNAQMLGIDAPSHDVKIRGIILDANVANNPTGSAAITSRATGIVTNSLIDGITIKNTAAQGINIAVTGSTEHTVITNSTFTNIGTSGPGGGIICQTTCNYLTVSNNTFNTVYGTGIAVAGAGNAITGNTIQTTTAGDCINSTGTNTDVTVTGNTCKSSGAVGIHVGGTGASIGNNTIDTATTHGVQLDACINCSVVGNSITGAGQQGIRTSGSTANAIITGNMIVGSTSVGIQPTNASNVQISNNIIRNSAGGGIALNGTSVNVIATNNFITGSTGGPLSNSGTGNLVAYGNIGDTVTSAMVFATLPACSATYAGGLASISDSSTVTWGATITGTGTPGTTPVLGFCDGTNWTVAGN